MAIQETFNLDFIMNYFKIFDITEEIDIDLDLLEEKYHNFQRNFHPDKAGVEEIEKSMAFNEGFEILSDEFSRIAHLLKINGIDVNNDTKAPKVDMSVLQEVMSLQERISEGEDVKNELKEKCDDALTKTKKFFNEGDFNESAQGLMKVKYLRKALKDLKKI